MYPCLFLGLYSEPSSCFWAVSVQLDIDHSCLGTIDQCLDSGCCPDIWSGLQLSLGKKLHLLGSVQCMDHSYQPLLFHCAFSLPIVSLFWDLDIFPKCVFCGCELLVVVLEGKKHPTLYLDQLYYTWIFLLNCLSILGVFSHPYF